MDEIEDFLHKLTDFSPSLNWEIKRDDVAENSECKDLTMSSFYKNITIF